MALRNATDAMQAVTMATMLMTNSADSAAAWVAELKRLFLVEGSVRVKDSSMSSSSIWMKYSEISILLSLDFIDNLDFIDLLLTTKDSIKSRFYSSL